jgi:hypothetical protein
MEKEDTWLSFARGLAKYSIRFTSTEMEPASRKKTPLLSALGGLNIHHI